MNKISEELKDKLVKARFKSAIVSIQHLSDLQFDVDKLLQQGLLSRDFYNKILTRYDDIQYNIEPPANFPEAKSIIITAA